MRILYIIVASGLLATLFLWLGYFETIKRKVAGTLAVLSMVIGSVIMLFAVLPDNSFFGPVLAKVDTDKKVVALTFDDGPYSPYTENLLQVLAKEQVKATFFVVAENALKQERLIKEIQAGGHEIALHSFVHKDQLKLSPEAVKENLTKGKAALEKASGAQIKYFRPPHGFKDWAVMQEINVAGLEAVNWSVMPKDWNNPGVEVIAQRVIEKAHPGAIVLLHDGDSPKYKMPRAQTVEATGVIIRELRKQGYEFKTISELKMCK